MKRIILGILLSGLILSCCSLEPAGTGTAGKAEIYSEEVTLKTQDYFSVLQQFHYSDYLYPYHYLQTTPPARARVWESVVLENDYVKVVVVPELGGRILKFINKATGNNEFYENPEGIRINSWGRQGWWMATGGTEFMAPYDEHGGMFYLPYEHVDNPSDGKTYRMERTASGAKLSMSFDEGEAFGTARWRLDVEVFLPDDQAQYSVRSRVTNESDTVQDLMFWSNTMISPGPGNMRVSDPRTLEQQVVFDKRVSSLYNHNDNLGVLFWGNPWDTLSWPRHTGPDGHGYQLSADISLLSSWYDNDLKFAGLFTPDSSSSSYLGQYNLYADEGIVKVFPEEIVPGTPTGVKYWHWGSFSRDASPSFADGDSTYAELMTGPVRVFQEPADEPPTPHPTGETYMTPVQAGGTLTWEEHYLAPWGIGTFEYADSTGVVRLEPAYLSGSRYSVKAGYYPVRQLQNCSVRIYQGSELIREETGVDIGPGSAPGPYHREFEAVLPGSGPLSMKITDGNGRDVLNYQD